MVRTFAQLCPRCGCVVLFTLAVGLFPFIAFCQDMLPHPVGLYPLNKLYNTNDASCYGNLGGTGQDAQLVTGPFGQAGTAYEFSGIGTSYISIPQSNHLDAKNSITILVWIFQTGKAGSVIQYSNNNRGSKYHASNSASMELRTSKTNSVSMQFVKRSGQLVSSLTDDTVILDNKWQYVGASYDRNSGTAKLWIDGKDLQQMNLGKLELRTDRDIQIGSGQGNGDSFEGRISCIQIYDRALTREEVTAVRNRCFMDDHPPVDCGKTPAPSGCGVSMNTLSGTFSSPGYPSGYPYKANCVWDIKVPSGYIITLKFSKFDLETSYITYPDCPDHVVVLDGINSWSDRLKTLCGGQSDWGEEIVSSGDGMRVEFTTDSDYSASGFIAKYSTSLVQNVPGEEKEGMMDFSRHYTGIVIGVACAAIFAIISIITFSHTRRRLRERRHGSLTRNRHSISFSDNDVFQQNAPPTYDDVMRYPELYPPTPCQGSLANTPAVTPRRGSPVSTPTIPHRLLNRPDTPALVPKVGTPIGMPLLNTRRGISTPQSTSRISLQRGISPLARAELTPQHSRHADHASSDEHDDGDNDDELPPYPGIINVDSVLDQVRETLEHRRFTSSHASNPSLSDSNSSQGSNTRAATNVNRGSQALCTVVDNRRCTQTRLEPNRNSLASLQSCGNSSHGHADPWVSSKVPRVTTVGGASRSIESDV